MLYKDLAAQQVSSQVPRATQAYRIGQRIEGLRPVQKFNEFQQGIAGRPPTEKEMQTGERLRSRIVANPRFQKLQQRGMDIQQKQMERQMKMQPQPQQDNQAQLMQQVAQEQQAKQAALQSQQQAQQAQQQQAQQQNSNMPQQVGGKAASAMGLGYAKGGYVKGMIVNKGVGASMKPHNVFGSKGKK